MLPNIKEKYKWTNECIKLDESISLRKVSQKRTPNRIPIKPKSQRRSLVDECGCFFFSLKFPNCSLSLSHSSPFFISFIYFLLNFYGPTQMGWIQTQQSRPPTHFETQSNLLLFLRVNNLESNSSLIKWCRVW